MVKKLKIIITNEDGSVFITGLTGKISGVFDILILLFSKVILFKTGERLFRLTSSRINEIDDVNLEGVETYVKVNI